MTNAPIQPDAIAAWRATQSSGVWLRAGMNGALTGLDQAAALGAALAHGASNPARVLNLLACIEAGAIEAARNRPPSGVDHV